MRGVAEDVVGAGGFFDPPGVEGREVAHVGDGFADVPALVGVHHELVGRADLLADDGGAAEIVGGIAADFDFEVGPAFGESFAAEAADLVVGEAEPAGGGGVGGVARWRACRLRGRRGRWSWSLRGCRGLRRE